jgi:inorganic pyrophosphatase
MTDPKSQQLFRSHPWHGVSLGVNAPDTVQCFIEIVPTDTVKYEIDKESGILKVDRPQKYSSLCPTLYGLLPQTYCGRRLAAFCNEKTGRSDLKGDGDPLDICVLTEKVIVRGDILVTAVPIGGFRLIDNNEADDKIISVMVGDIVFGNLKEVSECPQALIERIRHYFLSYKGIPLNGPNKVEITHLYGRDEAHEIIRLAAQDYIDFKTV